MISTNLENYINSVITEFEQIDPERRRSLQVIADFVSEKVRKNEQALLVFICTHNSRRSHISQIWAQAAASYYKINNVYVYSGGTEATAFNSRAVEAMRDAGFIIDEIDPGNNPVYEVKYVNPTETLLVFSKKYDDILKPNSDFCAVMTCSEADRNCPFIPGAELRVSLPYNDPKDFDGTPEEKNAYRERVRQIGKEMLFLFSTIEK